MSNEKSFLIGEQKSDLERLKSSRPNKTPLTDEKRGYSPEEVRLILAQQFPADEQERLGVDVFYTTADNRFLIPPPGFGSGEIGEDGDLDFTLQEAIKRVKDSKDSENPITTSLILVKTNLLVSSVHTYSLIRIDHDFSKEEENGKSSAQVRIIFPKPSKGNIASTPMLTKSIEKVFDCAPITALQGSTRVDEKNNASVILGCLTELSQTKPNDLDNGKIIQQIDEFTIDLSTLRDNHEQIISEITEIDTIQTKKPEPDTEPDAKKTNILQRTLRRIKPDKAEPAKEPTKTTYMTVDSLDNKVLNFSKYLETNSQFQKFLEGHGYNNISKPQDKQFIINAFSKAYKNCLIAIADAGMNTDEAEVKDFTLKDLIEKTSNHIPKKDKNNSTVVLSVIGIIGASYATMPEEDTLKELKKVAKAAKSKKKNLASTEVSEFLKTYIDHNPYNAGPAGGSLDFIDFTKNEKHTKRPAKTFRPARTIAKSVTIQPDLSSSSEDDSSLSVPLVIPTVSVPAPTSLSTPKPISSIPTATKPKAGEPSSKLTTTTKTSATAPTAPRPNPKQTFSTYDSKSSIPAITRSTTSLSTSTTQESKNGSISTIQKQENSDTSLNTINATGLTAQAKLKRKQHSQSSDTSSVGKIAPAAGTAFAALMLVGVAPFIGLILAVVAMILFSKGSSHSKNENNPYEATKTPTKTKQMGGTEKKPMNVKLSQNKTWVEKVESEKTSTKDLKDLGK